LEILEIFLKVRSDKCKKIKISGINLITSENILVIGNEKQIKEDIII
jgi:hypothetical protein